MIIREVNHELFEGKDGRRVPKKGWGPDGMMVGHSLMCVVEDQVLTAFTYMLHSGATTHDRQNSFHWLKTFPNHWHTVILELIQQVRI